MKSDLLVARGYQTLKEPAEELANSYILQIKDQKRKLKWLKRMHYGLTFLVKVKVLYEYLLMGKPVGLIPALLLLTFSLSANFLADYFQKLHFVPLNLQSDPISTTKFAWSIRGYYVVSLAFIAMATFNSPTCIGGLFELIAAIFGLTFYVQEPLFCTASYIICDSLILFPKCALLSHSKLKNELYVHSVSWILLTIFSHYMDHRITKANRDLAKRVYYQNTSENVMNLVKRPFVVCDKPNLSMPLCNSPMLALLTEYNFSSFAELAEALQVQSKVVLKQRSKKSYKREHILFQFQPFSYNPCITLKEFIRSHYGSKEIEEKEIRLACWVRREAGTESFTVTISGDSYKDELAVFVQKRSSQELIKKRRDQNRARNLLLKTLSHNIRNPLMAIMYLVDDIVSRQSIALGLQEAEKMRRLKNMSDLMYLKAEDLLDFALILEGEFVLKKEFMSVEDLVDELKKLLKQYIEDAALRFNVKIAEEVPRSIYTDKGRLLRILCHLGLNALKYTKKGFVLLIISYDSRKESVIFTLRDTGIGMSPEKAKTIENFITSDFIDITPLSYVEDPEDFGSLGLGSDIGSIIDISETGLGLYITGKICEKLGSRLIIKGMEGHGASFSFEINAPVRKHLTMVKSGKAVTVNETKTPEVKMEGLFQANKRLEKKFQVSHAPTESICEVAEELPEENNNETERKSPLVWQSHQQATFCKVLPKKGRKKKSTLPGPPPKRILVVDDQQINRFVVKEILKKIGNFEIDEATNGKEALELSENKRYNIIFMDLDMPVMNGFEATQRIREKEEGMGELDVHIPIIAITAYDTPEIISQSLFVGFNELIVKPVSLAKMRACINRHCPGSAY